MTGTDGAANDRVTNGSCLCGGVRFAVSGPIRNVLQCHCIRCRKFTGNFTAASGALVEHITFVAEASLRWFHPDDDPNVAYGFCSTCGSSLFWKVVDDAAGHWSIHAGALDDAVDLHTEAIWYADHAAGYTTLDPRPRHVPSSQL